MSMVEQVGALVDTQFDWLQRPSSATSGQTPNFFWFSLPDQPDQAYAFYQYPGQAARRNMGSTGNIIEQPRLQILARGPQIKPVMDRVTEIKDFLDQQQNVIIGGVYYLDIHSQGEIGEIGPDTAKRQRITCNFQVMKEPG